MTFGKLSYRQQFKTALRLYVLFLVEILCLDFY